MTNIGPDDQAIIALTPAGGAVTPRVHAGGAAHPEPDAAVKVTPQGLFAAFRRRLWPAIGFGILAAVPVAAAVWVLLPPPKPRVTATMYMTGSTRGTLFEHPDAVIDRQSQSALIRSKLVMSAALRDPDANATSTVQGIVEPVDWLSQSIGIDYPFGPEIVRLSLVVTSEVKDVEDAKKIVDAVRKSYLDEIVNKSASERRERLDSLQILQTQSHDTLRRKQASLRKLAEDVGSTDPVNVAAQQRLIQEQLGMATREFVKLQSDLRRMRLEEAAVRVTAALPTTMPSDKAVEQFVDGSPPVSDYLTRKAKAAAEKIEIERVATEPAANAKHQRLTAEMAGLDKDIAAARIKSRAEFLATTFAQSEGGRKTRLSQLGEQLAFQRELETLLANEMERLNKSVKSINAVNLDLEAEKIDIRSAEELYTRVSVAISTLQAEQGAPVRVRPLESASVAAVNVDGRKAQFAGGAFAVVLGIVCVLFALWEFFQGRVETPNGIGRACGLPVIGIIPRVPARVGRRRAYWQSMLTESMACTQTVIRYGDRGDRRPQLVLITSAGPDEGKTSLAAQLAVSFAGAGVKTLLIDGDLRQPSAHTHFGLTAGPGLAEVLRGESVAAELAVSVSPNLDFLPAGRYDAAALTALANGVGPADLRQLKQHYEMVIVDSSPILPVADASHLARQVDAVLITVLTGYSRTALVKEATRRLRQLGAPVLGLVVNGVAHASYGYGYGYGNPVQQPAVQT